MTSSRRFIVTLFSRYNYGTDFLFFRIHLYAGKDHRRDAEDKHDHAVDRVQMSGKKTDAQSTDDAEERIEHAFHPKDTSKMLLSAFSIAQFSPCCKKNDC